MRIYVHRNGRRLGPFKETEIRDQVTTGALLLTDQAWLEGTTDWVPLGNLLKEKESSSSAVRDDDPFASSPVSPVCSECSNPVPPGSKTCRNCGAPVTESTEAKT